MKGLYLALGLFWLLGFAHEAPQGAAAEEPVHPDPGNAKPFLPQIPARYYT